MPAHTSAFERVTAILKRRRKLHLVSHELLQALANEMAEVARQLRHAERFAPPTLHARRCTVCGVDGRIAGDDPGPEWVCSTCEVRVRLRAAARHRAAFFGLED